jgi:predicted membrane GTPase involved in stress response
MNSEMDMTMNFDLPIEQLVRRSDTRFQLGFATEARERIPAREGCALSASRRGLHVLARNEDGLAGPVETLRDVYGPSLEVSPPTVRLIRGVQVQEPIMHVRISLGTEYQEAVQHAMAMRCATVEETYARARQAVLRYEAPLAQLLGLPAELSRLTSGSARYWIVLSHYALVTGDPGGRAA